MGFSWTYLTRRFWLMNYRDFVAMGMISSYGFSHYLRWVSEKADNTWTFQRVYTDDESDIAYREANNKADSAVKRERAIKYAEKIK